MKYMQELIACCGLDCEECYARTATLNNDNELRKRTAKLRSELKGVPITADMINCLGCRTDGEKTPFCDKLCPIRQCVLQKGFAACGDCSELDTCPKVSVVLDNNPDTKNRLIDGGTKVP